MPGRTKAPQGGGQFNLTPAAKPVDTFTGVQKAPTQGAMSDLSQSLSSLANGAKTTLDVMKEQGEKQGQQKQLEAKSQTDWNSYLKDNPTYKPFNPWVQVGYNRALAKNTIDSAYSDFESKLPTMTGQNPQQFQETLQAQQQSTLQQLQKLGVGDDAINYASPAFNEYHHNLQLQHGVEYGQQTYQNSINQYGTSFGNLFHTATNTATLNSGIASNMMEMYKTGIAPIDISKSALLGYQIALSQKKNDPHYDPSGLLIGIKSAKVGDKNLVDLDPQLGLSLDKYTDEFRTQQIDQLRQNMDVQTLQQKASANDLESKFYSEALPLIHAGNSVALTALGNKYDNLGSGLGSYQRDYQEHLRAYVNNGIAAQQTVTNPKTQSAAYMDIIMHPTENALALAGKYIKQGNLSPASQTELLTFANNTENTRQNKETADWNRSQAADLKKRNQIIADQHPIITNRLKSMMDVSFGKGWEQMDATSNIYGNIKNELDTSIVAMRDTADQKSVDGLSNHLHKELNDTIYSYKQQRSEALHNNNKQPGWFDWATHPTRNNMSESQKNTKVVPVNSNFSRNQQIISKNIHKLNPQQRAALKKMGYNINVN